MAESIALPAVEEMVEVEIQDVSYWTRLISSKIAEIETNIEAVKGALGHLQTLSDGTEDLREQNEIVEDITKLSPTAMKLCDSMTGYILNVEDFKKLLMQKSFGKPRPPVLPIVRSFSTNVNDVVFQLQVFRERLLQSHEEYMKEHKKDLNLIRRIDRLVKNIKEEQNEETKYGLHQTSMNNYVVNSM